MSGFEQAEMVRDLALADNLKGYAKDNDIIAVLEKRILCFEDQIAETGANKRVIENAVRWEVELLAEDKDNKLTNETKRQIKYDSIIECNDEFQKLSADLKTLKREVGKLQITLDNEKRAFQLILSRGGSI